MHQQIIHRWNVVFGLRLHSPLVPASQTPEGDSPEDIPLPHAAKLNLGEVKPEEKVLWSAGSVIGEGVVRNMSKVCESAPLLLKMSSVLRTSCYDGHYKSSAPEMLYPGHASGRAQDILHYL